MSSFLALVKKDLKGYFDQPTGYILLVIFVSVSSFLYFKTVLGTEEASLRALFDIMPWMLAVFVPASTMRLVAEEQRDGTLEILLTQPIRGWSVLLSKFVAGLFFVSIGIVFTIGIPLSLQTAGDPDDGAIIAQYIGTFFLTAAFVAIGLFGSSLTRNQIVSFMLSLSIIMGMMLAGLQFITIALPSAAAVLVQDLSPLTRFAGIARGVLDLRDVLYFIALVSTFLSASYLMIRGKSVSHRSPLYRNLQLGVGGLVIISILVGWFGRDIGGRWDLTENKLYTLSDATEQLLAELEDIVTIKLFSSKDPPVQIAISTRNVNDFLDDLEGASKGKVRVVRKYPDESEEVEVEAFQNYVPPVDFSAQTDGEFTIKQGYLGMGMTYLSKLEAIPFVDSVDGLEYKVATNIFRMAQHRPKKIAVMIGHGEKRRDAMLQTLRNELERYHEVVEIGQENVPDLGLSFGGENPDQVDVLIVAGPTEGIPGPVFEELDDFLAAGGKALIMLDPVTVDTTRLRARENEFSMAQYVEQYGIKLQKDLVFDVQSNEVLTFAGRFGNVNLPYPYWVRAQALEARISGGIQGVVFPWSSPMELTGETGLGIQAEITPLVETSESAAVDDDFQDISPQSARITQVAEEQMAPRLLAVAVTGVRCPPFRPRCDPDLDKPFRLIVATDSDWISESMVHQYPQNLALGVNWLDWLTQEEALASIRAKGKAIRVLEFSSRTHTNIVQYGNVFGAPAIFVLVGLVRLILRRRQMGRTYSREG